MAAGIKVESRFLSICYMFLAVLNPLLRNQLRNVLADAPSVVFFKARSHQNFKQHFSLKFLHFKFNFGESDT